LRHPNCASGVRGLFHSLRSLKQTTDEQATLIFASLAQAD
jgi:hypothetical protein